MLLRLVPCVAVRLPVSVVLLIPVHESNLRDFTSPNHNHPRRLDVDVLLDILSLDDTIYDNTSWSILSFPFLGKSDNVSQ